MHHAQHQCADLACDLRFIEVARLHWNADVARALDTAAAVIGHRLRARAMRSLSASRASGRLAPARITPRAPDLDLAIPGKDRGIGGRDGDDDVRIPHGCGRVGDREHIATGELRRAPKLHCKIARSLHAPPDNRNCLERTDQRQISDHGRRDFPGAEHGQRLGLFRRQMLRRRGKSRRSPVIVEQRRRDQRDGSALRRVPKHHHAGGLAPTQQLPARDRRCMLALSANPSDCRHVRPGPARHRPWDRRASHVHSRPGAGIRPAEWRVDRRRPWRRSRPWVRSVAQPLVQKGCA